MDHILSNEGTIRIAAFAGTLLAMMALEALLPRRNRVLGRAERWPANLGVVVVDTIVARLLIPVPPVAAALWASENGIGVFNLMELPELPVVLSCILFLDLAIYTQHVVFHKVPVLWRLHRMHHADTEFDATTGIRFHPIEIILSLLIKIALVLALGIPAVAVIIFEVVLNASAMFNHANLKLPLWLDKLLRAVVVTPDMHRVHHSWHWRETDSNYGFCLSVWDRLFRTYTPQPRDGHEGMTIGLHDFRGAENRGLLGLLKIPFRSGENVNGR
ncbi:MAG: sterol desaturase family protein [Rhodospirillales bacterium]|nr:sterol desaturase family protein [Rhodospirillales bacterium]MBO6788125.1 sterol desaturase family protein [Rhodospirillales bacterium]